MPGQASRRSRSHCRLRSHRRSRSHCRSRSRCRSRHAGRAAARRARDFGAAVCPGVLSGRRSPSGGSGRELPCRGGLSGRSRSGRRRSPSGAGRGANFRAAGGLSGRSRSGRRRSPSGAGRGANFRAAGGLVRAFSIRAPPIPLGSGSGRELPFSRRSVRAFSIRAPPIPLGSGSRRELPCRRRSVRAFSIRAAPIPLGSGSGPLRRRSSGFRRRVRSGPLPRAGSSARSSRSSCSNRSFSSPSSFGRSAIEPSRNAFRNSLVVPYCVGMADRFLAADLLDERPRHEQADHAVGLHAADALDLGPGDGLRVGDDRQRLEGGPREAVLGGFPVRAAQALPEVPVRREGVAAADLDDLQTVALPRREPRAAPPPRLPRPRAPVPSRRRGAAAPGARSPAAAPPRRSPLPCSGSCRVVSLARRGARASVLAVRSRAAAP